ncbi:MAG: GNAT family N-acetyltransferase [Pseudomonadales bacterium]|nr:GNAT family N-acetyltransferase [Pseudomonadales bacterium]
MALPENVANAVSEFPLEVTLDDGETVEIRVAEKKAAEAILKFATNLDEQDLLFLRVDITEPKVVENWLKNVKKGETLSLLAWRGEDVVGYGTVDRNSARWTHRVGEIRVNVAPELRGQGLGRQLTGKIFDIARRLDLKKLTANMTPDQIGAQAAFTRLGFRPEALLADYIEDRSGETHDLVIMSYDIDGLNGQIDSPLKL